MISADRARGGHGALREHFIDGRTKAGKLAKAQAAKAKAEVPRVEANVPKPWRCRCIRSRSRYVALQLYALRAKGDAARA